MSEYNALNYTEQGGAKTVIGGTLEIKPGATVQGLSADPLQPAAADTLGGIKVGDGLTIDANGVLDLAEAGADAIGGVRQAANQAASTATSVADIKADFNTLLAALKAAGIMTADAEN